MRKSPFGLPESSADRFVREEYERTKLYRDLLGGGAVAEAVRQENKRRDLLRGLDFDAPYRGVLDTLERDRKQQENLRRLTSTAWALSITETARSVVERHVSLVEEQRKLSNSILDTVKAYDANRSVVETAMAAARASETYRSLITDALPRMSMFTAIAERMAMVDTLTLKASAGETQSASAFAVEMVIEAQRIATAIVEAPTEEESARLYGSFVGAVLGFFKNLGPNTVPELNKMGLIGFAGFIITLVSIAPLISQEDMSPQEKAAFAQVNEKVDRLRQEERHYHEVEAKGEQQYLEKLPQAELSRDATFRRKPARDGDVVLKAPKGMKVAIVKAQKRWRLVVFRDPLSNQLAQAWVYATAISPLAAPLAMGA